MPKPQSGLQGYICSLYLQNQWTHGFIEEDVTIIKPRCKFKTPVRNFKHPWKPFQSQNKDLKNMDVPCMFKSMKTANIQLHGVSKTSGHIYIKMIISDPNQENPAYLIAPIGTQLIYIFLA